MAYPKHWTILGSGAIGCLWAAYLSSIPDISCTLLSRPMTTNGSQHQSLSLHRYHDGYQQVTSVQTLASNQIDKPIQFLIIALKAYDLTRAIKQIQYAIAPKATVLVLMNGLVGHHVATLLPTVNLWLGCLFEGAILNAPLAVQHTGVNRTWIGPYSYHTQDAFSFPKQFGLQVTFCSNIWLHLWQKLGVNAIINGLSVKYQCENGDLLKNKSRIDEIEQLALEIDLLLKTQNMIPEKTMKTSIHETIQYTSHNISSTLQDIRRNRLTELPWINGLLVRTAQQQNLKLPQNEQLIRDLKHIGMFSDV
ncbi:MAG: 2-dehydropantoate 2-reductase [Endozoicomonadaceae bacterium]|nr:2-dehydropantoate 2-reductase [Endozoicomonadaceae bacterium]MBE8232306.1 2-dehydropantoate 2-reductase [Endozoicomonadaceae bacterium]